MQYLTQQGSKHWTCKYPDLKTKILEAIPLKAEVFGFILKVAVTNQEGDFFSPPSAPLFAAVLNCVDVSVKCILYFLTIESLAILFYVMSKLYGADRISHAAFLWTAEIVRVYIQQRAYLVAHWTLFSHVYLLSLWFKFQMKYL